MKKESLLQTSEPPAHSTYLCLLNPLEPSLSRAIPRDKPVSGVVPEKLSPYPSSPRFSPGLSSRSFIVLPFILRSVIQLEVVFVKGIRYVSIFPFFKKIDLYWSIIASQYCVSFCCTPK